MLGRDWLHSNGCVPSTLHQLMFFWNDEKIEVVYADKKPFVACSNFFEAKFDSGEVGPVEVAVKPNEEKTEGSYDSKGKIEEESADTEVRVEAVCQRL